MKGYAHELAAVSERICPNDLAGLDEAGRCPACGSVWFIDADSPGGPWVVRQPPGCACLRCGGAHG